MTYEDTIRKINDCRMERAALRTKMRELQSSIDPEQVSDYTFSTNDDDVTLPSLFGDKDTLFIVHNMGKSCPNCTMWADGLNGLLAHLEDRAAFVVSSPDAPSIQRTFADGRGWKFRMVSHQGTSFAQDMGYFRVDDGIGRFWPGVSVFKKDGDKVVRVSNASFGPFDDFNAAWNLFDLIPEGVDGWHTKFSYV